MKIWHVVCITVSVLLLVFVISNVVVWRKISTSIYDRQIYPGDTYTIKDRSYRVPDLELVGTAMLLKECYLEEQRALLEKVTQNISVEYWLSGGTLLGFTRHETFIPWDDDCDIHTPWENREYLYSSRFARDMEDIGLEAIYLRGFSSLKFATREGAAVRVRKQNTVTPIVDIFFVKKDDDKKWKKVDSWSGSDIAHNKKEVWNEEDLFPTRTVDIDHLTLNVPNNPLAVLKQQYGDDVMDRMYARTTWFSHLYPFKVFKFIWVTKK